MEINISPLFGYVNKHAVLTLLAKKNRFAYMRFGERLKLARGDLTQAKLEELSGVTQSLISQLENSKTATGSEYTPRLARALGINVDWLADEIGEMYPTDRQKLDPRIAHVMKVMEWLPPYAVDAGVREIDSLAELVSHMPKPNGSHG